MASPALVSETRNPVNPVDVQLDIAKQWKYIADRFSDWANLGFGYRPIELFAARGITTNAILTVLLEGSGNPILERVDGATDKMCRVTWAADDVAEVQLPTQWMTPEIDTGQDVELHLFVGKDADADATTIDAQVFNGLGDTEMGAPVTVEGTAIADYTVTLAAATVAPGSPLGISLIPGAHAGDDLHLYAAVLKYYKI